MKSVEKQGTDPVGKLLLQYSVPAVAGFLANALYQFVDRVMVGRGVGTDAMAAVTCVYPLTILAMGVGLLLGTGTGNQISTFLGQGRKEEAEAVLGQSLRMGLSYGIGLALVLVALAEPILWLFGVEGAVLQMAVPFLRINAVGQISLIAIISMGNILRVQGRPGLGLAFMAFGNILNAALAYVAIFVLGWGVAGAALATALAQAINFAAILGFVQGPSSLLRIQRRFLAPNRVLARGILKLGAPIFLMQILGMLVFLSANYGAAALGGSRGVAMVGVFNTVSILLIYPTLGVTQAMQPLIAYNLGAGQRERVRSILSKCLMATTTMGTLFAGVVLMVPGPIAALFSRTDSSLIELVRQGLPWFMVSVAVFGIQGTASHYCLASQQPGKAGLLLMGRQLLAIPLFLVLPRAFGFQGLFLVAALSDIPCALVAGWLLLGEWRKLGQAQSAAWGLPNPSSSAVEG